MNWKKPLTVMALALALLFAMPADLGATPPPWAPAHGYRMKTRHIYFPQQNMYYDLQRGVYIFVNNGQWAISASIPTRFMRVNFSNVPQVQIAVNSPYPYRYHQGYSDRAYYEYCDKDYRKAQKREYREHKKWEKQREKEYRHGHYR